jgi:hypothetical protein
LLGPQVTAHGKMMFRQFESPEHAWPMMQQLVSRHAWHTGLVLPSWLKA